MEDLLPYRWKCLLLLKEMETELQRLRVEEACGAGKVSECLSGQARDPRRVLAYTGKERTQSLPHLISLL